LYAAGCIAELYHYKKLTFNIEDLRSRIKYGIKPELLELASLRGVGRIRARQLYAHGYHKLGDLKNVSETALGSIKTIGKSLAHDILDQIRNPLKRKPSSAVTMEEPAQETAEWSE
jgi:helicase